MLVGMAGVVYGRKEVKWGMLDSGLEISRDVVHALAGVVIIGMFYFFTMGEASFALLYIILLGVLVISDPSSRAGRNLGAGLYRLERKGLSPRPRRALWLALGALVPISFVGPRPFVIAIFAAMFIGDPLANSGRGKFQQAEAALQQVEEFRRHVCILCCHPALYPDPFIGAYAIGLAAIAAVAESIEWKVDDNFAVPFILTVLIGVYEVPADIYMTLSSTKGTNPKDHGRCHEKQAGEDLTLPLNGSKGSVTLEMLKNDRSATQSSAAPTRKIPRAGRQFL